MTLRDDGFTLPQSIAVFIVGIIGVLFVGLQPQLLGALVVDGRLTLAELGNVATVELLAMGIAAGGASLVLPTDRLRIIAVAALLVTGAVDLATPMSGGTALLGLRAAAGLAEGVLVWLAIGLIVRSAQPARWSGLYLMLQTLAQFGLATLLGTLVIADGGAPAGFAWLAGVTLLGLVAVAWLPAAYAPLEGEDSSGMPPARGFVALAGVLFYLAAIVAVWVYVEALGIRAGVTTGTMHMLTPLSLAMQVAGAGLATLVAGRIRVLPVVVAVAALNLMVFVAMAAPPSPAVFVIATAGLGFLWLFALPLHVPLVIAADPSRRAAALIGGAQLVGSSLGPFAAAWLVVGDDAGAVPWIGVAGLGVGVILLVVTARRAGALPVPGSV